MHTTHTTRRCSKLIRIGLSLGLCLCLTTTTLARVRLENLCKVQGQKEHRLIGMGLVIGLPGTGDGGKSFTTVRALASALKLLNNPVDGPERLQDSKNVALVMIEATIPAQGIRRGQKIDCLVNSIGGAKSLKGGRLMVSPLQSALIRNEEAVAIAGGAIVIEDPTAPTGGRIPNGVVIEENFEDFAALMIENGGFNLLLDPDHASFHTAQEVARAINDDLRFEVNEGATQARAISPGVIHVDIPEIYRNDPVRFISQVLDVGVDNPHTEARVVLNHKSGTIIVTGEVQISPVVISHKNLSITVGDTGGPPGEDSGKRFVPLMDQSREASHNLKELESALNQLQVPKSDIIEIIKELKASGKLHAVVIVE